MGEPTGLRLTSWPARTHWSVWIRWHRLIEDHINQLATMVQPEGIKIEGDGTACAMSSPHGLAVQVQTMLHECLNFLELADAVNRLQLRHLTVKTK